GCSSIALISLEIKIPPGAPPVIDHLSHKSTERLWADTRGFRVYVIGELH
ncbi:Hypothetical predicted protein, partial [Xyrichtys novacula]